MKKINWGIVGLGDIAHKFASAIQVVDNANLYAVSSRSRDKSESFKDSYNAQIAYASYDALFKDENIDVVYIAVPHHLHHPLALEALKHGKAVLLEKPACLSTHELQEVLDLAKNKNLFFMEAMKFRFSPAGIKIKEIIDSGVLGKINYVSGEKSFYSNVKYNPRLFDKKMAGGALYDVGVYPMSFYQHLFNEPIEIKNSTLNYGDAEVDTSFSLYGKTKSIPHLYFGASIESYAPGTFIIGAENGFLEIPKYTNVSSYNLVVNGKKESFNSEHKVNGLEYQIEASSNCILKGQIEHPLMTWDQSLEVASWVDSVLKQQ